MLVLILMELQFFLHVIIEPDTPKQLFEVKLFGHYFLSFPGAFIPWEKVVNKTAVRSGELVEPFEVENFVRFLIQNFVFILHLSPLIRIKTCKLRGFVSF